ncbi:MAG: hypothetical protein KJO23_03230 [Bacteroidia bacterium]|nr:hypothetical protein [Bacteroidia bacterium]NNM22789.1 hypothetical protein [Flavobacteriaceae bacterium]
MKKFNFPLLVGSLAVFFFNINGIAQSNFETDSFSFADPSELNLHPIASFDDTDPFRDSKKAIKNENEVESVYVARPSFEVAAWYGLTFGETENQNGIRRLDVKYTPNSENLLYLFYDNALSLDNNRFAALERTAPIVGVGAKHDWTSQWFSKLEVGRRFLTTEEDQHLFNIENGYFFSSKLMAKLITQYDLRQNDDLITLGGFVEFEVMRNVRLETGMFHAENITLANTRNQRYQVVPKLLLGKSEFIMGVYYDRYLTQTESLNQFGGAFGLMVFPVTGDMRANLFFNYDRGFRNEITVLSFGLNQKF